MADDITGKRILIIATDGFEQSELEVPRDDLKKAGAEVVVAAPKAGKIKGWDETDWGQDVAVDKTLAEVSADDFDAVVLPGGVINPDKLRTDDQAISLIKGFAAAGKPIAAICHAPWLLIQADLVDGKRATSVESVHTDLANAGANVVDESVVVDGNIITSRTPKDLPDFVAAISKAVA